MSPKKLPTERVKNQIPEFGVSNLPLVLPSFFRAMCTYSQIPNEAGSGGKLLELFEFSFAIIML